MSIKSILELLAEADTRLPDNTDGQIGAADVRDTIKDLIETLQPAHAIIGLNSLPMALNAVPQVLAPFNVLVYQTPGVYTPDLPNGQITHMAGAPVVEDIVAAFGNVSGGNGADISVVLFVNGVATAFSLAISTAGAGNVLPFSLTGLLRTVGNAVYELRAFGAAGAYTFTNVKLMVSRQPVQSFI